MHFFWNKGTSIFHKRVQFCERLYNTKFKLWWIKKTASITPKRCGIYFFQVSLNLNILKHYYQKTAPLHPRFSTHLKSKPLKKKKQTLQYQFSTDTCSFHFSNFSSMNSEERENSNTQKCFIRYYTQVVSQLYSSVVRGTLHGMAERGPFSKIICYPVLPNQGMDLAAQCHLHCSTLCGWYFPIIPPVITLYSLNVNPQGGWD